MNVTLDLNEKLFHAEGKDVKIQCSDGDVSAHKCVLSAVSEVFAATLKHEMLEKSNGVISIDDATQETMKIFLRLIYTGHVSAEDWGGEEGANMSIQNLLSVAKLAKRYMIGNVQSITTQVLKVRLENAVLSEDVDTFQTIFSMAIGVDIIALRVKGIEIAEAFPKLKVSYNAQELSGDVQSELEAIWPIPLGVKRARLA